MKIQNYLLIGFVFMLLSMSFIAAADAVAQKSGFSLITIQTARTDSTTKLTELSQSISSVDSKASAADQVLTTQVALANSKADNAIASANAFNSKLNELLQSQDAKIDRDEVMLSLEKIDTIVIPELNNVKTLLASVQSAQTAAEKKAILAEAQKSVAKARTVIIESKTGLGSWESLEGVGSFGKILRLMFGPMPEITENLLSAMMITIAVWLLLFITFGDIISSFSTFSTWVSWTAALLIGIIAANLGFITKIIVWFTGGFAIFGITSVYIGLVGAFVVFLAINLGVTKLGPWIMGRNAMMKAHKAHIASVAGGARVAGAVKGMKDVGKALAAP